MPFLGDGCVWVERKIETLKLVLRLVGGGGGVGLRWKIRRGGVGSKV